MTMISDQYTLIVIDMQEEFVCPTRMKSTITACEKLILDAKNDFQPIIFAEYIGCGSTLRQLYNLVDGYSRFFPVRKSENDGSLEIRSIVNGFKLPKKLFKVCGVNTDYCVIQTIEGMRRSLRGIKIDVYEQACNSNDDHLAGIEDMKKFKNVNIIY